MEQFVLVPLSVYDEKIRPLKKILDIKPKTEEKVPVDPTPIYKSVNRQLKSKSGKSIVDQILESPRIRLSNSDTIILDGRDTLVSIVEFVRDLKRKNPQIPDIYFTILDATKISRDLVVNPNAKSKDRGNWIPFQI